MVFIFWFIILPPPPLIFFDVLRLYVILEKNYPSVIVLFLVVLSSKNPSAGIGRQDKFKLC